MHITWNCMISTCITQDLHGKLQQHDYIYMQLYMILHGELHGFCKTLLRKVRPSVNLICLNIVTDHFNRFWLVATVYSEIIIAFAFASRIV